VLYVEIIVYRKKSLGSIFSCPYFILIINNSTSLFIHGTGVRGEGYAATLKTIRSRVADLQLPCHVDYCDWGDAYGIDFDGLSLPSPPKRNEEDEAQALRWEYLEIDPLFDLRLWCTPAAEPAPMILGAERAAFSLWEDVVSKISDSLWEQG
jgi:hypothetical protein